MDALVRELGVARRGRPRAPPLERRLELGLRHGGWIVELLGAPGEQRDPRPLTRAHRQLGAERVAGERPAAAQQAVVTARRGDRAVPAIAQPRCGLAVVKT